MQASHERRRFPFALVVTASLAALVSAPVDVGNAADAGTVGSPPYVDARRWSRAVFDLDELRGAPPERSQRHQLRTEDSEDGLQLATTAGGNGHLEWSTRLRAADIDAVVLSARSDGPAILRLLWKRERDERFAFARHVEWRLDRGERSATDAARRLRSHPDWSGEIRTLRLQIEAPEPVRVQLERFELRGFADEQLARAFEGRSRLALRLGLETRPTELLAPGRSLSRALEAGRWWLRGAVGNPGREPGRLRIVLENAAGEVVRSETIPVPRTREWWTPFRLRVDTAEALRARFTSEGVPLLASLRPVGAAVPAPVPRVVLVSLDTLRRDAVGLHGSNETPQLDAFGRAGWVFDAAFSPSPWTLPAHMTLFTGLSPGRHGVETSERPLPPGVWTLPQALRARGFETIAVTEGGFVDPRLGFHRGFDRYVSWEANHRFEASIELAREALTEATGPVFLFFHTYQAHTPYEPEPGAPLDRDAAKAITDAWLDQPRRLPAEQLADLRETYRSGVRRLDESFGRLIAVLDALPAAEPDIRVVTSDHGEAFHERDDFLLHAEHLYPELLAVPLLVQASSRPGRGRVGGPASLADVAPTIAALLGFAPDAPLEGRSLAFALRPGGGPLPARGLAASAQSSQGAYRFGAIAKRHVDVVERDALGHRSATRLPFDRAVIEARDEAAAGPEALYRESQRGRWEIDLRLDEPRSDLAIELESSGEIRDVLWLPAADNVLFRNGPGHVSYRHRSGRPQAWARLLVELHPADASLRILVSPPEAALALQCGAKPPEKALSPERCFAAAGEATALALGQTAVGRLRVRRYPGTPPGVELADGGPDDSESTVDADMAAQLAALGYLDTLPETKPSRPQASASRGTGPPAPATVVLKPFLAD